MSADIDTSKGFHAFAFTGNRDAIWHGKGNQIGPDSTIEEIIKAGGLDFRVSRAPFVYQAKLADGNTVTMPADNKVVTYRDDTGGMLGCVSANKYKLDGIQPADIVEFFRDFLRDNGLTISTVGALRGGRIVWALAKLGPEFDFIMPGNDKIERYVRLQTSYDGSLSTSLTACDIRQVCANTMEAIEYKTKNTQYRTTHSQTFNKRGLQAAFGLLGAQFRITAEAYNNMAARKVSDDEARAFFLELVGVTESDLAATDDNGRPKVHGKTRNMLNGLAIAYKRGPGSQLASADGTAFGLLQAVTYFADHEANTRDTNNDGKAAARLASAWYGAGANLKNRAREAAAKLAGVKLAA